MDEIEFAFHDSFKPRWGPRSTLLCPKSEIKDSMGDSDQPWEDGISIVSEGRSVSLLKFGGSNEVCSFFPFCPACWDCMDTKG